MKLLRNTEPTTLTPSSPFPYPSLAAAVPSHNAHGVRNRLVPRRRRRRSSFGAHYGHASRRQRCHRACRHGWCSRYLRPRAHRRRHGRGRYLFPLIFPRGPRRDPATEAGSQLPHGDYLRDCLRSRSRRHHAWLLGVCCPRGHLHGWIPRPRAHREGLPREEPRLLPCERAVGVHRG